jgi:hypothetical protein
MLVKCVSAVPDASQMKRLGARYLPGRQEFGLVVGRVYTVFGLRIVDGEPWLDTVDPDREPGYLFSAPLFLFQIVDGRVPGIWQARLDSDGELRIAPPSFFAEFYFDDLFEEIPAVVEDFQRVRRLIEAD